MSETPETAVRMERIRQWLRHRNPKMYEKMRAEVNRKHDMKAWFQLLDNDGSGEVDVSELQDPLMSLGIAFSPEEVAKLVESVDEDGTGEIGFDEFYMVVTGQGKHSKATFQQLYQALTGGSTNATAAALHMSTRVTQYRRSLVMGGLEAYALPRDKRPPETVKKLKSVFAFEGLLDAPQPPPEPEPEPEVSPGRRHSVLSVPSVNTDQMAKDARKAKAASKAGFHPFALDYDGLTKRGHHKPLAKVIESGIPNWPGPLADSSALTPTPGELAEASQTTVPGFGAHGSVSSSTLPPLHPASPAVLSKSATTSRLHGRGGVLTSPSSPGRQSQPSSRSQSSSSPGKKQLVVSTYTPGARLPHAVSIEVTAAPLEEPPNPAPARLVPRALTAEQEAAFQQYKSYRKLNNSAARVSASQREQMPEWNRKSVGLAGGRWGYA